MAKFISAFLFVLLVIASCSANRETRCAHQTMNLHCSPGKSITISDVQYGRSNTETCGHGSNIFCFSTTAKAQVESYCNRQDSCSFPVNDQYLAAPDCGATNSYLTVTYRCQ